MDYLKALREFASRVSTTCTPRTRASTATAWTTSASWRTRSNSTRPNCPAWATWTGATSSPSSATRATPGPVCVEVEDRAYEGSLELRKAALVQSAAYLRQFVV